MRDLKPFHRVLLGFNAVVAYQAGYYLLDAEPTAGKMDVSYVLTADLSVHMDVRVGGRFQSKRLQGIVIAESPSVLVVRIAIKRVDVSGTLYLHMLSDSFHQLHNPQEVAIWLQFKRSPFVFLIPCNVKDAALWTLQDRQTACRDRTIEQAV